MAWLIIIVGLKIRKVDNVSNRIIVGNSEWYPLKVGSLQIKFLFVAQTYIQKLRLDKALENIMKIFSVIGS